MKDTDHPRWLIPLSDGSPPIAITIRSERVVPPCVHVDFGTASGDTQRLLTSLETVQFGMALQEASKYAGQLRAKLEGRKR